MHPWRPTEGPPQARPVTPREVAQGGNRFSARLLWVLFGHSARTKLLSFPEFSSSPWGVPACPVDHRFPPELCTSTASPNSHRPEPLAVTLELPSLSPGGVVIGTGGELEEARGE